MRPTGRRKKKITPFDIDEYRRMEYWRVSTATKAENKRKKSSKKNRGQAESPTNISQPSGKDEKITAMHQGTDQTYRPGRISEKRTK